MNSDVVLMNLFKLSFLDNNANENKLIFLTLIG